MGFADHSASIIRRRGRGGNQSSRRCPRHESPQCADVRAGRRDLRLCRPQPAKSRPLCGGDVGHAWRQHEDGAVSRTVSAEHRPRPRVSPLGRRRPRVHRLPRRVHSRHLRTFRPGHPVRGRERVRTGRQPVGEHAPRGAAREHHLRTGSVRRFDPVHEFRDRGQPDGTRRGDRVHRTAEDSRVRGRVSRRCAELLEREFGRERAA